MIIMMIHSVSVLNRETLGLSLEPSLRTTSPLLITRRLPPFSFLSIDAVIACQPEPFIVIKFLGHVARKGNECFRNYTCGGSEILVCDLPLNLHCCVVN